jgi:exonuclease III
MNKRPGLQTVTSPHNVDIICITKYAPKNTTIPVQESELQIKGYDMFTNVDKCKRGVIIYTKKELKAVPSKIELKCDFEENSWCEIKLKGSDRLLVGCVYRSPNSDVINNAKLMSSIRKVCTFDLYSVFIV